MSNVTDLQRELAEVGAAMFTARDYRPGRVTHSVFFKLLPGMGTDVRESVLQRFLSLRDSTRDDGETYISSVEGGLQMSAEDHDPVGFDLGFVMTFASLGDRNYYVGAPVVTDPRFFDPMHAAFKEYVSSVIAPAGVLVFDTFRAEEQRATSHEAN